MAAEAPEAWIGSEVTAVIVLPRYGEYGAPANLTAWVKIGILEDVNQYGILASLSDPDDEKEEAVRRFYPWGAVLSLELEDQG